MKLDFWDYNFDLLVNNFMVDLIPHEDFDKLAVEFYRVVKPGGRAVIFTFSFREKKISHFWFLVAKKIPDEQTGCRSGSFKEILKK